MGKTEIVVVIHIAGQRQAIGLVIIKFQSARDPITTVRNILSTSTITAFRCNKNCTLLCVLNGLFLDILSEFENDDGGIAVKMLLR
jgi:hypothetical protein